MSGGAGGAGGAKAVSEIGEKTKEYLLAVRIPLRQKLDDEIKLLGSLRGERLQLKTLEIAGIRVKLEEIDKYIAVRDREELAAKFRVRVEKDLQSQEEIQRLKRENEQLKHWIDDLTSKRDDSEATKEVVSGGASGVAGASGELPVSEEELQRKKALEEIIEDLKVANASQAADLASKDTLLRDLGLQVSNFRGQLRDKLWQIERLKTEREALGKKEKDLEREVANLKSDLGQKNRDITDLKAELVALEASKESKSRELEKSKKSVDLLEKRLAVQSERLKDLESQVRPLHADNERLQAENAALHVMLSDLRAKEEASAMASAAGAGGGAGAGAGAGASLDDRHVDHVKRSLSGEIKKLSKNLEIQELANRVVQQELRMQISAVHGQVAELTGLNRHLAAQNTHLAGLSAQYYQMAMNWMGDCGTLRERFRSLALENQALGLELAGMDQRWIDLNTVFTGAIAANAAERADPSTVLGRLAVESSIAAGAGAGAGSSTPPVVPATALVIAERANLSVIPMPGPVERTDSTGSTVTTTEGDFSHA